MIILVAQYTTEQKTKEEHQHYKCYPYYRNNLIGIGFYLFILFSPAYIDHLVNEKQATLPSIQNNVQLLARNTSV